MEVTNWKSEAANIKEGKSRDSHDFNDKVYCYCMDTAVYSLSEESLERIELESRQTWSSMRQTNLICDAVLQTEDGGKFTVHKAVIAICSKYFKALFTTKINNAMERSTFCIPGVTANVMKEIVDYAYGGMTTLTDENVVDILIGADQLNVLGMLKDCCDFLSSRMNFQNCIGIKKFAKQFFCFELEKEAEKFLMCYFVEVSEQSLEYLELSVAEIIVLLNSEKINVKNEELVWEAGVRWIDYCPQERRRHVDSIMRCVRLGLLDTQYFMDHVKQHRYVENNELCKPIVIETLRFLWDLEMIGQRTDEVETPFLATPRIPYSILFTVGGWSGGAPTSLIETYDTKADRWIQVDETDPNGARAYHKLAVIGYDIYVIGGFDGNEYFNSCRCFNAVTKQWKDIAPMHSKRCYVSVATLNNLIYAMGGYDGHHRQNTVERYDYHTNQWTLTTPMNVQRSDACATTLNGLIYIVGGFNGNECLASCEYYNPATDHWTTIVSMHQRRSGVSVISHHGKIYALGGFNGISRLSNGEKYDPVTEEWSDVPDMFNPRSNFAIEVMDDMIFVIGGFNGVSTIFHVECFDERSNEWFEATDMNAFRSALAACIIPGLPNVNDYVHQNRQGLMEEKRQKLLQQRTLELERNRLGVGAHVHHFRAPQDVEDIEDPE